ncbi:MAG TPA: DUF1330 domain-containing protein [Gammaproteobacteria bacterium]|nr:DUF1330 domain-containing protein [Gammaproteobacteria bacterium]
MGQINPTGERLKKLSQDQRDQPVVMINLLRFRERATYAAGSGDSPCSGEEAYQRYAEVAGRMLQRIGGRMLWLASVDQVVIGEDAESWDEAILVQYPSRKAFLEMLQIPEYRDATRHRDAALEDSRLFACTTRAGELGD